MRSNKYLLTGLLIYKKHFQKELAYCILVFKLTKIFPMRYINNDRKKNIINKKCKKDFESQNKSVISKDFLLFLF